MTEEKLRSLLENTITEHSHRCLHSPEFTVTSGMEEEASLLMTCLVSRVSDSCLDPPLSYVDRSHKSTDPRGLHYCFSTCLFGSGFSMATSNKTAELHCTVPAGLWDLSKFLLAQTCEPTCVHTVF